MHPNHGVHWIVENHIKVVQFSRDQSFADHGLIFKWGVFEIPDVPETAALAVKKLGEITMD